IFVIIHLGWTVAMPSLFVVGAILYPVLVAGIPGSSHVEIGTGSGSRCGAGSSTSIVAVAIPVSVPVMISIVIVAVMVAEIVSVIQCIPVSAVIASLIGTGVVAASPFLAVSPGVPVVMGIKTALTKSVLVGGAIAVIKTIVTTTMVVIHPI